MNKTDTIFLIALIVVYCAFLCYVIWDMHKATKFRKNFITRSVNLSTFVAIDFETMNLSPLSACSVAAVKYVNGVIVDRYHTLIKPVRDFDKAKYPPIGGWEAEEKITQTEIDPNNEDNYNLFYHIHHISLKDVENAPTFGEIYPELQRFIGKFPIVAHNALFDTYVLESCKEYYLRGDNDNTAVPHTHNFKDNIICTSTLKGWKSLAKCCKEYNINLDNHHDALCDAKACGYLYMWVLIGNTEHTGLFNEYEKYKTIKDLALYNFKNIHNTCKTKYRYVVKRFPHLAGVYPHVIKPIQE